MFLVAVFIIVFLMYKFYAVRAYMIFQMTLISPVAIIVGVGFLGNDEYRLAGLFIAAVGVILLILTIFMYRITAKNVAPEQKKLYYRDLFLYGGILFIRAVMIMLLIFIPIALLLAGVSADYRERLDTAGRTVCVDKDLRDPQGRQYHEVKR